MIIGAGISGIVFLEYAKEAGLRCLVLDKQDDVGGLWNWIPEWQDIQNRKEDFAIDGIPLEGDRQPAVQGLVRRWVREFGLEPSIRLGCEVTSVSRPDGRWRVVTNRGEFGSRYLVVASGVQNQPWIPDVTREDSAVDETHSSALERPEDLAGRQVTVVGGGASALDMLELAVENGAKGIQWVYRNTRWFFPSSKSKQENPLNNLRRLSLMQAMGKPPAGLAAGAGHAGPDLPSLPPGGHPPGARHRPHQGPDLPRASGHDPERGRHLAPPGEVAGLHGREVVLTNGERFETDVILWGTGYRMNLDTWDCRSSGTSTP